MPKCFKIKFYKIEFENSVRRLSFLCCLTDIKFAWINPCTYVEKIDTTIFFLSVCITYTTATLWNIFQLLFVISREKKDNYISFIHFSENF